MYLLCIFSQDNTCLINGECHSLNEKKGSNHCKLCDPSVSTSSWTNSDSKSPYTKKKIYKTIDFNALTESLETI